MRRFAVLAIALMPIIVSGHAEVAPAGAADKRLEVYWVDVEGGGATLIVTPAGESILVDTGNPGGRDAGRIHRVATEVAKIKSIDHVVITHYHADHFGGAAELAELMPIGTLYENGPETAPEKERGDPRLDAYKKARVARRVIVKPGDEILLKRAAGAATPRFRFLGARQSFAGDPKDAGRSAARPNTAICESRTAKEPDISDNANSVVMLLEMGPFRFYDGGDLTWNIEGRLACPFDRVGKVDVYQSTHHGLDQSNNPVLVKTLQPTVVVFNNGPRKGLEKESAETVRSTPSVQAIYQLHRNVREGAWNGAKELIANEQETCAGAYVKLSVDPKGASYTLAVPSTGHTRTFKTRQR